MANGQIPLAELTLVDGWAYLERRTARAYVAACDKMQRLGYARPSITAPDGAYRDLVGQRYWKKYWTDRGKPGNAATPGYSNHGLGRAIDIWNVAKWPRTVLRSVFQEFGFIFDVASEAWHARHDGREIPGYASTAGSTPFTTIGDTLSAVEVGQIQQHTQAVANNLLAAFNAAAEQRQATLISVMKETARKTTRGQLYFDSGPTGQEFTPETSPRASVSSILDGFVWPLSGDLAVRKGQIASLRETAYMLIDANSAFNGLPSQQYTNMENMAAFGGASSAEIQSLLTAAIADDAEVTLDEAAAERIAQRVAGLVPVPAFPDVPTAEENAQAVRDELIRADNT